MYAVYAWNLFILRAERIDVLVYVKNVGTWATRKVPRDKMKDDAIAHLSDQLIALTAS
jgi:hypothetical protein